MKEPNLGSSTKTVSKQNGTSGKQFSSFELIEALRHVEDMLAGTMTPFFLLGETAKQAVTNQEIAGSRVVLGVSAKELTPENVSTWKTMGMDVQPNGFTYVYKGVPVTVKFIRSDYKFLRHPDTVHFAWDTYQVPNPFQDYWEMRMMIK